MLMLPGRAVRATASEARGIAVAASTHDGTAPIKWSVDLLKGGFGYVKWCLSMKSAPGILPSCVRASIG